MKNEVSTSIEQLNDKVKGNITKLHDIITIVDSSENIGDLLNYTQVYNMEIFQDYVDFCKTSNDNLSQNEHDKYVKPILDLENNITNEFISNQLNNIVDFCSPIQSTEQNLEKNIFDTLVDMSSGGNIPNKIVVNDKGLNALKFIFPDMESESIDPTIDLNYITYITYYANTHIYTTLSNMMKLDIYFMPVLTADILLAYKSESIEQSCYTCSVEKYVDKNDEYVNEDFVPCVKLNNKTSSIITGELSNSYRTINII